MTAVLRDAYGLTVSTASRAAVDAYERGSRLFESVFGRIPIAIASDLQDSVALAWRLDLFGHPDPRRWTQLGAAARRWLDMPLLLFHDLHVGMALSASGDWADAELQLSTGCASGGRKSRNPTLGEVVVPLMEGLHAFARGDYALSVARIEPVEARIVEVGGRHAQREVFHDTLLATALRGHLQERTVPLLERRLAKRPNPGAYWTGQAGAVAWRGAAEGEPSGQVMRSPMIGPGA